MKPAKRAKIKALLDNPASTPNEKEICRKLLKDNPEDLGRPVTGREVRDRMSGGARSRGSGIFWEDFLTREQGRQDAARRQAQAVNEGVNWYKNATDSARRQQQAAQGSRFYPGAGPDLSEQLRQAKAELQEIKDQMAAADLRVDYGPITDFYKHLEKLRKERNK